VKITTEKLPRSLLSVQIELDKDRFERGLDQAARRLAQKYPIHGFRPGKAPRFMIERSFGREALVEEASKDLINKAFRDALAQEQIEPIGPASLEGVSSAEPFVFTITVPVAPTVEIGDYRAIRVPLELTPISDEQVERMMDVVRDRHVVLKELDEPRPVQEGDQLRVHLDTLVDGELLEPRPEGAEAPEQTLDIVEGRLVDELYAGLLGAAVGDQLEIAATLPEDHGNEQVRGKEVTFKVEVLGMQERLLPEWEELPTLENFEGSLEDLRAKTRVDLEESMRNSAERKTIDSYIEQLVAQTSYDIPDVMVEQMAESILEDQGRQFARYGITIDQMLQYRGQTREDALKVLMPDAERQAKITLALQELVRQESLVIAEEEIEAEVGRLLLDYDEDQHENVAQVLQSQLRGSVASSVLDRKLRERMLAIAIGEPAPAEAAPTDAAPADPTPAVAE
jgi:trigger factor